MERPLAVWLRLLCTACAAAGACVGAAGVLGCSRPPAATATVSTSGPGASDAGEDDAGSPPSPRGPKPVWPAAEAELAVPYRAGTVIELLRMAAHPGLLDLHMNIDTTSSMSQEIDALQAELRSVVVPMLEQRVANASFGVSAFQDFPSRPFGADSDRAFRLLTPITSDIDKVQSAVAQLDQPLGGGGDDPEAGGEALYQIATGAGFAGGPKTTIASWHGPAAVGGGTLGGVGFRPQALHVVLHATDALAHTSEQYAAGGVTGARGMAEAINALAAMHAQAIAIMSTACTDDACRNSGRYMALRGELSELALRTGATMSPKNGSCPTGISGASLPTYQATCPLVFDVHSDGRGLTGTIIDAVLGLIDGLRFSEVHAEVDDDPLGFVQAIVATALPQAKAAVLPQIKDLLPKPKPDGIPDSFVDVHQSTQLGFSVRLRDDRLPPSDLPQRFRLKLRIVGDGLVLQERVLRVVIPALPAVGADAGALHDDAGR